jgi:hypothetical protein
MAENTIYGGSMRISRGNKIIIAVAGFGLAIILFLAYLILFTADQKTALDQKKTHVHDDITHTPKAGFNKPGREPASVETSAFINTSEPGDNALEDRIVMELQRDYGKNISQKSSQAALFEVKKYIISLFPGEDGRKRFYQILKRAFPEQADEIMKTLDKLEEYNQWLADNDAMLSQMSEYEKKLALWKKREELFGEEALKIWSGELLASEARKKTMQDTMSILEQSKETTLDEKLDVFKYTLQQTYENTPDEHVLNYKEMSAMAFFSLESAQEDLKQMSPDQRQMEINKVRRELGYSQDEIEKMADVDAEREKEWENGLRYMKEREEVASQYNGEDRKEKLKEIREKYFKEQAKTIELEEEKDFFFRFKRPREYGIN